MTAISRKHLAGSRHSGLARLLCAAGAILGVTGCAADKPQVIHADAPRPAANVGEAIVAVEADGLDVDLLAPWGSGKPWSRTLTGLVVDGHRILVGGWNLRGHRQIRVEKPGTNKPSDAHVVFEDADQGMLLLAVDDDAFWSRLRPAQIPPAVATPGVSHALGARQGEARVGAAEVKIIGTRPWGSGFLRLRLTADKNIVRSADVIATGPSVLGIIVGEVNGEHVALSSKAIDAFLADASRTSEHGRPSFGLVWQPVTSAPLRQELGLSADEGGFRILRVLSHEIPLRVGDVVVSLDGKKVDKNGNCERVGEGKGPCTGIVLEAHKPGDVIAVEVVRDGARKTLEVPVHARSGANDMVPYYGPTEPGTGYAVEGGLVFENLTGSYLGVANKDWEKTAPVQLSQIYALDRVAPTDEKRHVVILTRVLADPATLGYQHLRDLVVDEINGVRLRALDDVHDTFAHPVGAFDVITLAPGQGMVRIVLDAKEVNAANERLRAEYHLPERAN